MTKYGQIVIGPPGSGKTTYCTGLDQYWRAKERPAALVLVNLDPANERQYLPYQPAIDLTELINLQQVMEEHELGPNGALVYCMQYLETNLHWLIEQLQQYDENAYFVFDLPGQVELYTHENVLAKILQHLQKELDMRLTVVHLVDAQYCTDPCKFISVVLLSLSSMIRLEMPHINVLSKIDLIEQYGALTFNLEAYLNVQDLQSLIDQHEVNMNQPSKRMVKYRKLNSAIIELIEDYRLVRFLPLNIQDASTVEQVLQWIDKSNGYAFVPKQESDIRSSTMGAEEAKLTESIQALEETHVASATVEETLEQTLLDYHRQIHN